MFQVDSMGNRLSPQQKEVHIQVMGFLQDGRFSKGLVSSFVQWMFFMFPQLTAKEIEDESFWEAVGFELTESTKKAILLSGKDICGCSF